MNAKRDAYWEIGTKPGGNYKTSQDMSLHKLSPLEREALLYSAIF